jgi:hypothetical protein
MVALIFTGCALPSKAVRQHGYGRFTVVTSNGEISLVNDVTRYKTVEEQRKRWHYIQWYHILPSSDTERKSKNSEILKVQFDRQGIETPHRDEY